MRKCSSIIQEYIGESVYKTRFPLLQIDVYEGVGVVRVFSYEDTCWYYAFSDES